MTIWGEKTNMVQIHSSKEITERSLQVTLMPFIIPYLNSSLIIVRVDVDTLYVEFCWG